MRLSAWWKWSLWHFGRILIQKHGGLASSKHHQLSSWFSLRGSTKIKPIVRGFLRTEVPHGSLNMLTLKAGQYLSISLRKGGSKWFIFFNWILQLFLLLHIVRISIYFHLCIYKSIYIYVMLHINILYIYCLYIVFICSTWKCPRKIFGLCRSPRCRSSINCWWPSAMGIGSSWGDSSLAVDGWNHWSWG